MAKSPAEMAQSMVANLKEKTGKTLEQWLKVVKSNQLQKHGEIVKMLKADHGMTHGYANLVAQIALKGMDVVSPTETGEQSLIENQYQGKENLRPIYDKLISVVESFGNDVEVSAKKSYVSLRRSKQFAIVQPSTKSRIDVGLKLKDVEPAGRLEKSGSFNSMVTHRVRVTDLKEVDSELKKWLKNAYKDA